MGSPSGARHDPRAAPRLLAKCRELMAAERSRRGMAVTGASVDDAARILALAIVKTAASEGHATLILDDGREMRLPRHVRRMKLHRLMDLPAAHAN